MRKVWKTQELYKENFFPLTTSQENCKISAKLKAHAEKRCGFFQLTISIWLSGFEGLPCVLFLNYFPSSEQPLSPIH